MQNTQLILQLKKCGKMLYQNREQEAYDAINNILQDINRELQLIEKCGQTQIRDMVLWAMQELITCYKLKDNLGLADLLYYAIPELVQLCDNMECV